MNYVNNKYSFFNIIHKIIIIIYIIIIIKNNKYNIYILYNAKSIYQSIFHN